MINHTYVKKDAVVIDVGINVDENGKLCGDVDFSDLEGTASAATRFRRCRRRDDGGFGTASGARSTDETGKK